MKKFEKSKLFWIENNNKEETKLTLFDRVFGGNDYNYARTVAAIDAAIAQYGEAEPVAFPATAYNLPCYYSITGKKINNLGAAVR